MLKIPRRRNLSEFVTWLLLEHRWREASVSKAAQRAGLKACKVTEVTFTFKSRLNSSDCLNPSVSLWLFYVVLSLVLLVPSQRKVTAVQSESLLSILSYDETFLSCWSLTGWIYLRPTGYAGLLIDLMMIRLQWIILWPSPDLSLTEHRRLVVIVSTPVLQLSSSHSTPFSSRSTSSIVRLQKI